FGQPVDAPAARPGERPVDGHLRHLDGAAAQGGKLAARTPGWPHVSLLPSSKTLVAVIRATLPVPRSTTRPSPGSEAWVVTQAWSGAPWTRISCDRRCLSSAATAPHSPACTCAMKCRCQSQTMSALQPTRAAVVRHGRGLNTAP